MNIDFETEYGRWRECGTGMDACRAFWERFSDAQAEGLAHYFDCRDKGTSASLAIQFALGATPAIKGGDTNLWRGWNEPQFQGPDYDPFVQDQYRLSAERKGVNTVGRRYLHQLAEYPGDVRAWVADTADIRRVCVERGYSCEGVVNVAEKPFEPPAEAPVKTESGRLNPGET